MSRRCSVVKGGGWCPGCVSDCSRAGRERWRSFVPPREKERNQGRHASGILLKLFAEGFTQQFLFGTHAHHCSGEKENNGWRQNPPTTGRKACRNQ